MAGILRGKLMQPRVKRGGKYKVFRRGGGLRVEFGDEDELWSDAEETRRA